MLSYLKTKTFKKKKKKGVRQVCLQIDYSDTIVVVLPVLLSRAMFIMASW